MIAATDPGPWRALRLMVAWEAARLAPTWPFMASLQVLISVGLVVGLGLLIPDLDAAGAAYLSTGAATFSLVALGLIALPQQIARQREEGMHDYLRTLPVPAPALVAGLLVPLLVMVVPGAMLAVLIASWTYGFTLSISPLALPIAMLVAATSAAVGYALATASPHPLVTDFTSQALLFFVMLYSPVNYPADRLPGWLQSIHAWLPIEPMADLMRSALTDVPTSTADITSVAAWSAISFVIAAGLLRRRH